MSRKPEKISLLLADVDGTLVTREKVLTERAMQAVADLRKAGILFAITSGRPPKGMEMVIGPLGIDTPVAGFNGGLYTDAALKTLDERKLPADIARQVVEMIVAEGLDAWLYAGNEWLVHRLDAPHVAREQKTVRFPPIVVADFGERIEGAVKIVGVSDDHERIARCAKAVKDRFGHHVSAALSQPYYLDVTHPDANKGGVVDELVRRLNIPAEEIATIGDMANDVAMFEKGGFAIAMGNADDEVKGAADAVTSDCDKEGFAEAVEHFIIPRAKGRDS